MRYRDWLLFMLYLAGAIIGMYIAISVDGWLETLLGYVLFIVNGANAGEFITRKRGQS